MVSPPPPQPEMQRVRRRVARRFMGPPRRAEPARMRACVGVVKLSVKLDVDEKATYENREARPSRSPRFPIFLDRSLQEACRFTSWREALRQLLTCSSSMDGWTTRMCSIGF